LVVVDYREHIRGSVEAATDNLAVLITAYRQLLITALDASTGWLRAIAYVTHLNLLLKEYSDGTSSRPALHRTDVRHSLQRLSSGVAQELPSVMSLKLPGFASLPSVRLV
jgi:hypothetical protein